MSEYLITIKIEELEEGSFLATSNDLQGLIAQGRTIAETMEIAQDVARKLIESAIEHGDKLPAKPKYDKFIGDVKIPVDASA
ncbi:MAG: type II toxin-antitoxin system HicB family antitoxin [Candidatus Aenigmarchaeota archaeon]|nr:type II toxin-antitoxin system HicB family antitoxin [Candidatus Aenigmarchaeota archaeon]